MGERSNLDFPEIALSIVFITPSGLIEPYPEELVEFRLLHKKPALLPLLGVGGGTQALARLAG